MPSVNKKGISDIIVSIILIIIGITALTIMSSYVYKSINDTKLSPAFSCLEMQTNPTLHIQNACYDSNKGDIILNINREKRDFDFNKMCFIIDPSKKNEKTYCCTDQCGNCEILQKGENKNYYIKSDGLNKKVSLNILGCTIEEINIKKC